MTCGGTHTSYGHAYQNSCSDLALMNDTWTSDPTFAGMPVVYTEINWSTNTIDAATGTNSTRRTPRAPTSSTSSATCTTTISRRRLRRAPYAWYVVPRERCDREREPARSAGHLQRSWRGEKSLVIPASTSNGPGCPDNANVVNLHTLSNDYWWLRNGECHNP